MTGRYGLPVALKPYRLAAEERSNALQLVAEFEDADQMLLGVVSGSRKAAILALMAWIRRSDEVATVPVPQHILSSLNKRTAASADAIATEMVEQVGSSPMKACSQQPATILGAPASFSDDAETLGLSPLRTDLACPRSTLKQRAAMMENVAWWSSRNKLLSQTASRPSEEDRRSKMSRLV